MEGRPLHLQDRQGGRLRMRWGRAQLGCRAAGQGRGGRGAGRVGRHAPLPSTWSQPHSPKELSSLALLPAVVLLFVAEGDSLAS